MTQGNLVRWHLQEGKSFKAGDVLFEVETDKAQLEVDAPDDGILVKIVIPEGTKDVQVNATIAYLGEEGESMADLKPSKTLTGNHHGEFFEKPFVACLPSKNLVTNLY
jgi:pyruvate dehydrogenase E2 component (dihydrolipoamide acetyltransferase)